MKMFPTIPNDYEETISYQAPHMCIGLSPEEDRLLEALENQAQMIAPHLARALNARIQQLAGSYNTLPMSNLEIQLYLQDWFMQLFKSRDTSYLELSDSVQRINQLVLLTGIDVILMYAQETVKSSSNPEKAFEAFNKALARKIASEQLQSQTVTAQHLYDMMLLD
jgi:hypothetical protein